MMTRSSPLEDLVKATFISLALALLLASLALPAAAQDAELEAPVHTCLRITTDAAVDDLDAAGLGRLLLDGVAVLEVLAPEVCDPADEPGADEPGADEPEAYVDFVAHAAGAAIKLAALAEKSAGAEGRTGLDRAAKRLARWAKSQRKWLDRHPPQACYADAHAQWRRGLVQVRQGAEAVRKSIRTLRAEPMRRAMRDLAAGATALAGVDLDPVTRACIEAARDDDS
jgi:hypothetical protein